MATLWADVRHNFAAGTPKAVAGSARSGYVDMLHSATVSTARCCKAGPVAMIDTADLTYPGQIGGYQFFWGKFKVDRGIEDIA
jgi:hypothetical protein